MIDSEKVHYFSSLNQIPEILRQITEWQDQSDTDQKKGEAK
jgi:hypothetical protein